MDPIPAVRRPGPRALPGPEFAAHSRMRLPAATPFASLRSRADLLSLV